MPRKKKENSRFYSSDLALLHDRYYSEFAVAAVPGVLSILRSAGIYDGTVLDLGCGGGQLSARLLRSGYSPLGIDVSVHMVGIARKRVRAARFLRGSIAEAKLPSARAAVALGEVFNYLSSRAEMARAFKNIFRALRPGGVLIFDFKIPLPGAGKKHRSAARWGKDWAIFVDVTEDPVKNSVTRKIVTFRKRGKNYRRSDEEHRQIVLPAREVLRLLHASGYQARILDKYGKYQLTTDHKVVIATKPREV